MRQISEILGLTSTAACVDVLVDVVDPTQGIIGGDDVTSVPAKLDLASGAIALDNPKHGHPLLNWVETGVSLIHDGQRYYAQLLEDNLPEYFYGEEIVDYIRKHGYHATIDVRTLTKASGAPAIAV